MQTEDGNAGGGSAARAPRIAGLHRANRPVGVCGLCGEAGQLTKTHVPPRKAFNSAGVSRQYFRIGDRGLELGRAVEGGIWIYGLCASCNGLQGAFDTDYRDFARKMRPYAPRDWDGLVVAFRPVPQFFTLRPGAVARSILIGMFGLSPNLRVTNAEVAAHLLAGDTFVMPKGLELRLALCRGRRARVGGAIGGFDAFRTYGGGKRLGIMSNAHVYFPPLAWELADEVSRVHSATDFDSMLDAFGWADVSAWTQVPPLDYCPLHRFFRALPALAHPRDMPLTSEYWIELMSDTISEIIIADNV